MQVCYNFLKISHNSKTRHYVDVIQTSMKGTICTNIHHYAPPIECSITHRASTSLAAAGLCGVSEDIMSSFKSITLNGLC